MASQLYLKRLELSGFKSFARKAVFTFDPGMTAVVGPNGCGKSNIIDAVRWVLGEQSARALRGGRMEELIFHGSEKEKMLGMAEVSLVLDNEAGLVAGQGPEVMVTRRVYRSGESEYLLNRSPVRLKDITDAILDTGISTENYVIMEQGKIDAVLNARPAERMAVFEEAAGVMRYQKRKEEAEGKLEATLRNLERVNDLVMELRRQREGLERQARQAENYKEMHKRGQELRSRQKAGELVRGQNEMKDTEVAVHKVTARLEEARSKVAAGQAALREARERLEHDEKAAREAEEELGAVRERERTRDDEVNSMRLQLQSVSTTRDERQKRLDREVEDLAKLEAEEAAAREAESIEEAGLERLTPEAKRLFDEAEKLEAEIAERRAAMAGRREEAAEEAGALKDTAVFEANAPFETAVAAHETGFLEELRASVPAAEWPLSALFSVGEAEGAAVLAALGPLADSAVVDTWDDAKKVLGAWRGARDLPLAIVVLEAVREPGGRGPLPEGASKWADEMVTCAPRYAALARALLGEVAVVDGEPAGQVAGAVAYTSGVKVTSPGVVWWPGRPARAGAPRTPEMAGRLATSVSEMSTLSVEVAAREAALSEARAREADARVESARLETRLENARKARRAAEERLAAAQGEVDGLRADLEGLGADAGRISGEVKRREEELARDQGRSAELARRAGELAARIPAAREAISALDRGMDEARGVVDGFVAEQLELEPKLSAAAARFDIAREEFARDFATQADRLEELAASSLSEEEAVELARIEAKLADVGQAINMAAIEEFQAVEARLQNYETQMEDLRKSRESLQRAIQRLDRESEKRFDEAFDMIKANFNLMFRRLFGGGNASLQLLESEEGERGVEIEAQPPGKRTQNIALLSGGERALISTALLFALFMAKPSPFCLMDEIDGQLDDANIDRFLKVVKEFSERTQFIIISHNKHTMEVVDNLYGITMEEHGVSRIVSVRLKNLVPAGRG